jgi:hypothetical protein
MPKFHERLFWLDKTTIDLQNQVQQRTFIGSTRCTTRYTGANRQAVASGARVSRSALTGNRVATRAADTVLVGLGTIGLVNTRIARVDNDDQHQHHQYYTSEYTFTAYVLC